MGALSFLFGAVTGQIIGAWAYRESKRRFKFGEWRAATVAGVVATVVTAPLFILNKVHEWLLGPGAHWGLSILMAVFVGICQGVLFRGRPLARRPSGA